MIRNLDPKAALPWDLLLEADPNRQLVTSYIDDSQLLVYEEETIVGVIAFQEREDEWEIMNLAVAEDQRGKGIAGQLLDASFAKMNRQAPKKKIVIKTGDLPSPALHLYMKKGFQPTALIENYFVTHYPEPIYENGQQLRNQLILTKNF